MFRQRKSKDILKSLIKHRASFFKELKASRTKLKKTITVTFWLTNHLKQKNAKKNNL